MGSFHGHWICALGFTAAICASAAGQTPQFALWITEVNGFPCNSCPTRNLPEDEVFPGDVIRVDAFVTDWDDERAAGICSGSPNHGFGQVCDLNAPGTCTGMHCLGSLGVSCQTGAQCFPFPVCVPSQCIASPQVAAFQWALDPGSLNGAERGTLSLAAIECDPADCADVSQGNCPCAQFHQLVSECTCAFNQSCAASGYCGPSASAFIEPLRSDFLFANQQAFLSVNTGAPAIQFLGALTGFDAAVLGTEQVYYIGTLLLTVSNDAGGPFTVRMIGDSNFTFLNDRQPVKIAPATFLGATINVPRCAFVSCDDFDACTVDTMDPISCACTNAAVSCPAGQRCEFGSCVDEPRCIRIMESLPENCGIDARVDRAADDPMMALGIDRLWLRFDDICDSTRLRMVDFEVESDGAALAAAPVIVGLQPDDDAVVVILDAVVPIDAWFCTTYVPSGGKVCVAHVPGDVNGDQRVGTADTTSLMGWLGRMPAAAPPVERTDLNRSGATDAEDLITALDLLHGAMMHASRLDGGLFTKCPSR